MSDFSAIRTLSVDLGEAAVGVNVKARAVVRKSAADLEKLAKRMAPKRTGALRDDWITSTSSGLTAEIGPTIRYAPFVEYGTARMKPRPFLGPATTVVEPKFEAAIAALGVVL